MIPARILGTGSAFPPRRLSTLELAATALPHRDPAEMARRTGIVSRAWLDPGAPVAPLATEALRLALEAAGLAPAALRRIILATSTGGDNLIPATAHDVAEALGLDDTCDAFDVNNSCAGFLTALDLAVRSAATGLGPIGVVAVEAFSRHVSPERPRPYLVLGDGAGAAIVGASDRGDGLLAVHLRSSADLRGRLVTALPARTGRSEQIDFTPSAEELTATALSGIERSTAAVLREAGLSLGEIEWVLPHQPNGEMLPRIVKALGVAPERTVPIVAEIGSLGAASIAVSLDRLMRTRPVGPGHRILMTGVGSGTAYGALLYQVAR